MSFMQILKYSDGGKSAETLRQVCTPIDDFEEDLGAMFDRMFETLIETKTGVGLACPQVGVTKRAFILNTEDNPKLIVINPEIMNRKGEGKEFEEGCLSFPETHITKTRSKRVKLKFQDTEGNFHKKLFKKFDAIVVQHEIDHLDGVLFID